MRIAEPLAALDLDSDRILVRTGPQQVAALAGAKWPDRLPLIVQARLTQSFQNAGLARQVGRNPVAAADYELDLDIRKFELDVARSRVEIDVAAKLVSASGGVAAAEIFTADAPVASTAPATVAAAMDGALQIGDEAHRRLRRDAALSQARLPLIRPGFARPPSPASGRRVSPPLPLAGEG